MKNKIISFVLAVLMVVGCVGTFAIGASAEDGVEISITPGEIVDGKVDVTFAITKNPGFAGFQIIFNFDNTKAKIVGYEKDEDDNIATDFVGITTKLEEPGVDLSALSSIAASFAQPKNTKKVGKLFTVTFKVFDSFEITVDPATNLSNAEHSTVPAAPAVDEETGETTGKVNLPAITGLSFDDVTVAYDGNEHSVNVRGADSSMSVAYDVSNKLTNVGSVNVTVTVSKPGYSAWVKTATLKVTARPITVTGLKASDKDYDATTVADLTGGTLENVISGDDVKATMPTTGTFEKATVGEWNVTFPTITLTGSDAGNYILTQPTVKAKISARTIGVTADAVGKKVGSVDPALTYTYSDKTFVDARGGFTGNLARTSGEAEGEYDITRGTLATVDENLRISFTGAKFTIYGKDPQVVSVTPDSLTFTYGDAGRTITVLKTAGPTNDITFESSDTGVVTVDTFGNVSVVGAGSAVITVKSLGDATYADFTKNVNVTVEPKTVTVTPDAGQEFTYGDEVVINYTFSDTVSAGVSGSLSVESTNAGTQNVTIGTMKIASNNYKLVLAPATVKINPKELTVSGIVCYPRKKGDTPVINVFASDITVTGTVGSDKVNVMGLDVASVASDMTVSGLSIDNTNYTLGTVTATGDSFVNEADVDAALADQIKKICDTNPEYGSDKLGDLLTVDATNVYVSDIINKLNELLPAGYEFKFVGSADGSIDASGVITPGSKEIVTDLLFEIYKPSAASSIKTSSGETTIAKTSVIIAPAGNSSRLQALILYYYMKRNQGTKLTVSPVSASVAAGKVVTGTKVVLSTETNGATIYYTTNGTTPTSLSTVYTAPIVLAEGETTIIAIAMKSGMTTSAPVTFKYTVSDVVGTTIALKDGAADIKYMAGRGDKFEAEADATRYEVIAALAEVFNITTDGEAAKLSDVAEANRTVVDLFTAAGIINGYSDGTFRGDKTITRAEFAKIVCVMLGLDTSNAKDAGFKDTDHWAKAFINACAEKGLIKGKSADRFDPNGNIKRGEIATLVNRITGAKAGTECKYADVSSDAWYFGDVAAAAK